MSALDDLGSRMKNYEQSTKIYLPPRTYTIIRVDGKAFHSYCKGLERPYDKQFMHDMDMVAEDLVSNIQGAVFAFTQSDEISVLLQDFQSHGTQPWMGGVLSKMVSISASMATASFNKRRPEQFALFDSRVFTISSRTEVMNYFVWRQRDATRNSIQLTGQTYFSHKELQNKNTGEIQEMLWSKHGVNWNDMPEAFKQGRVAHKDYSSPALPFVADEQGYLHTLIPQL